jgi:hypothetical protein
MLSSEAEPESWDAGGRRWPWRDVLRDSPFLRGEARFFQKMMLRWRARKMGADGASPSKKHQAFREGR